jgi:hypothetical protein
LISSCVVPPSFANLGAKLFEKELHLIKLQQWVGDGEAFFIHLKHLTPSRKQETKFSQSSTKSLQPLP